MGTDPLVEVAAFVSGILSHAYMSQFPHYVEEKRCGSMGSIIWVKGGPKEQSMMKSALSKVFINNFRRCSALLARMSGAFTLVLFCMVFRQFAWSLLVFLRIVVFSRGMFFAIANSYVGQRSGHNLALCVTCAGHAQDCLGRNVLCSQPLIPIIAVLELYS